MAAGLIPSMPVTRRNHRGIEIPTGVGVAVLAGTLGGIALVAFVRAVSPRSPSPTVALAASIGVLVLGFGFGAIGLYDDIAAQSERGWRAHLPALLHGRMTPGVLKLVAGAALAFVIGSATATSFGWGLINAALIGLMANLFNAFDVRPGRAAKLYLLAGVPMAILGRFLMVPLAATLGAVAAFLAFDLRERAMLGDAGSNAIGAILGGATVAVDPPSWFRLALLALLVLLTAIAERSTLSAWIDRIGPLRAFDRLWRTDSAEEVFALSDRNAGEGSPDVLR